MEMPGQDNGPDLPATTQPATPPPSALHALSSWARDLAFCIFVLFFIIIFFYQPVKVEGGSMEPGLEDQERIFINKLVYRLGRTISSDIVVFWYPREPRISFIDRV